MLLKKKQSSKSLRRVFRQRKDHAPAPDVPVQISPPIPDRLALPLLPDLDLDSRRTHRRSLSLTSLALPSETYADQPWRTHEAWAALQMRLASSSRDSGFPLTRSTPPRAHTSPSLVSTTHPEATEWRHRGGAASFLGSGAGADGGEDRTAKPRPVVTGNSSTGQTSHQDKMDSQPPSTRHPPGVATMLYRLKSQQLVYADRQRQSPSLIPSPPAVSARQPKYPLLNTRSVTTPTSTSTYITYSAPFAPPSEYSSAEDVAHSDGELLPPLLPTLNKSSSFTSLREGTSIAWGRRPSTPRIEFSCAATPSTSPVSRLASSTTASTSASASDSSERGGSVSPTPPPRTPSVNDDDSGRSLDEHARLDAQQLGLVVPPRRSFSAPRLGETGRETGRGNHLTVVVGEEDQEQYLGERLSVVMEDGPLKKKRSWLDRGSSEGLVDARSRRGGWI